MLNPYINRRAFLRASAASVVTLTAGAAVAQEETPKRGGDLAIAVHGGSNGDSLDPRTFNSPYLAVLSGTVFNTLIETSGEKGELVPGLAASWEGSEDGKVWTFHLAEGVKFHDSRPMTAKDVIFSFNSHIEEGVRSNSRVIIKSIAEMEAIDDLTLKVTLKEPNQFFPGMLTNYSLAIVPEGTIDYTGIGTGAYKITRFAPGEIMEAERFDDYFRADTKGHVDTVALIAVNDGAARLSAIQTGQVHIATQLDPRSAVLLEAMPNVALVFVKGAGFSGINMMLDRPPFDNPKLREAMKYAIDRQDIIARVYSGNARLGNDTPVPPNSPDFAADLPQHTYDPERARALYEESGHSGPLVLQTSEAAGSGAVDIATLFKEHAAAAGIEIEIKREPADGYWANVWASTPFHSTLWGARATSEMIMSLAYSSGSGGNDTAFKSPEFDQALARARSADNPEERFEAFAEAQRILSETGGVIIPAFGDIPEGISTNLRGYDVGIIQLGSTRAAENVWFAD